MSKELQEQIEKANEQIGTLKIKSFDLQEALQAERQSFGQFANVLSQLLGFEEEESKDLQNYVNKVAELTGHAQPEGAE